MFENGYNILAADIATGVFVSMLLLAFWPWDDKAEQDHGSSEAKSEGEKGEVQE